MPGHHGSASASSSFEIANPPLDPNVNDAGDDEDNDGLTNFEEFQIGTDPNNSDTDNDGVNDGDEITAGTNPLFNVATAVIPIINTILFD